MGRRGSGPPPNRCMVHGAWSMVRRLVRSGFRVQGSNLHANPGPCTMDPEPTTAVRRRPTEGTARDVLPSAIRPSARAWVRLRGRDAGARGSQVRAWRARAWLGLASRERGAEHARACGPAAASSGHALVFSFALPVSLFALTREPSAWTLRAGLPSSSSSPFVPPDYGTARILTRKG